MSERLTRHSLGELRKGDTDWERLDRLTDAEIAADIASDPDAAPLADAAWFETATLILPEDLRAEARGSPRAGHSSRARTRRKMG